jgi:oligogalacturonide lyase
VTAHVVRNRLTDGRSNAQHLYFTGPSLTADDRRLVFLADAARPARGPYDPEALVDVHVLDRRDGAIERLSDNRTGVQRSYVYFGGHPDAGIAPGSVALAAIPGVVCYLHGRLVHRADVTGGKDEVIAEIASGMATGYGALSDDGTRYCLPAIDASAFMDLHRIDETVRANGLASHLWIFDTSSGRLVADVEVSGGWVTHAQFRPRDASTIAFNHEWAAEGGRRRIWLWDGRSIRPLRAVDDGDDRGPATPDDEVEHEVWTRDGERVVYHGRYAAGPHPFAGRAFLGSIEIATGAVCEIPLPIDYTRYGHVAPGAAGRLVTDGLAPDDAWGFGQAGRRAAVPARLDGADAPPEDDGGGWISRLDVDWKATRIAWTPLVRHGSTWSSQDAHPHPVFDHAGSSILFTSDDVGYRAVYEVAAAVPA